MLDQPRRGRGSRLGREGEFELCRDLGRERLEDFGDALVVVGDAGRVVVVEDLVGLGDREVELDDAVVERRRDAVRAAAAGAGFCAITFAGVSTTPAASAAHKA